MNNWINNKKISSQLRPMLAGVLLILAGCSTEEPVSTSGSELNSDLNSSITLRTVSTRPWLVTGGDVLVEIVTENSSTPIAPVLELNGSDISSQLVQLGSTRQQALLTDLPEGNSRLVARLAGQEQILELTNYPISGPIISGPHESPYYCQTNAFELANGQIYGPAEDAHCFKATRIDYVYWSSEDEEFKPYIMAFGSLPPTDIAEIVNHRGQVTPFIVRVETGVVNRAIYEIAMLHDPADPEPTPWELSDHWNGKLVYTHGGGCRSGWYQQGTGTGGVLRYGLLSQGYAVTSSSLNVFGQNCNDLLASETHIMVKERFIEHYGEPIYTVATGVSGGSYQSHQTADNYPGVFDGIIVGLSFPDVTSATIFTLADSRLLDHYFRDINPDQFTEEQQRAIAGFAVRESVPNLARGAARLDPIHDANVEPEQQGGEVSVEELEPLRYDSTSLSGVRATVYDHTVNVYGLVPGTSMARRPLDNVGVQYGLAALNAGQIEFQQFLDLNRDIGGFDLDLNHVPDRHRADLEANRRALESGRILYGGAGLAQTPVIDYRQYMDQREGGDIHMMVHQFSTRQRLMRANGHADNHVMQVGGLWGFTEDSPDLADLFSQMDDWIMAIQADYTEATPGEKVVMNRPETLTDACWEYTSNERSVATRQKIEERQTYTGTSTCNSLYPAYPTPRQVAGAPLANDVVSCRLRPVSRSDYAMTLTPEQFLELEQVFPDGVCDWSQADASNASHQGVWKSFGPSPVNRLY